MWNTSNKIWLLEWIHSVFWDLPQVYIYTFPTNYFKGKKTFQTDYCYRRLWQGRHQLWAPWIQTALPAPPENREPDHCFTATKNSYSSAGSLWSLFNSPNPNLQPSMCHACAENCDNMDRICTDWDVINRSGNLMTLVCVVPLSGLKGTLVGGSLQVSLAFFGSTSSVSFTVRSGLMSSEASTAWSWRFVPVWSFGLMHGRH